MSTWSSGNTPHPDGLVLRPCWRSPSRPFKAPVCCRAKTRRIGFGVFRCSKFAAKIWPERLHHRLLLWWNPFRDGERPFWDLFHVVRWAKP